MTMPAHNHQEQQKIIAINGVAQVLREILAELKKITAELQKKKS